MVDCCTSSECKTIHPNKHRCPANGVEYTEVSERTIAHHIKHSWRWDNKGRRYFFCDDPSCDIVYFGDDDSVILKSQLRTKVGAKDASDDAMLCYCFGITKTDVSNDPSIRDFVVTQTKLGLCSCDTSNPSGRCCLKNFPRDIDTSNALRNLNRLRAEFPLQARIEAADIATRDAYAAVLMAWLQGGIAPQSDIILQPERDKLVALDAVVVTDSGLGCYPFSALSTGIEVEFGAHCVPAMCAIDALAVPFLARSEAVIRAHCCSCNTPLTVKTNGQGIVTAASPAGVCVEYRQLTNEHASCCSDLCPGISFLCGSCCETVASQNDRMSLEDATAVGRYFFYFQSRLICL